MKTILQVEDDPNDVYFFQHAMKRLNLPNPIQVVTDGREAVQYLKGAGKFADRQQFPMPDLVLLDLKLPHLMGLDVLQWIRKDARLDLVVVLLTASAEEVDIATAYHLGANAFLVKPSEARKMVELVRAMADFWLTHNTVPQVPYRKRPRIRTPARPPEPRSKRLFSRNGTLTITRSSIAKLNL
jgi:CheY-like chemotaxis protein